MYFNNKKNSTNIDHEFSDNNDNILSRIVNFISKYKKIFIIGIVVIVLLIVMLLIFTNKDINNYLILSGDEMITIYQGDSYVEPGYKAYNSRDEDLSGDVKLESNLNTGVVGEYEILYKLGDITKVRYVKVIEKPQHYVFMSLTPVNDNIDIYLKKGDKYIEPGYRAFSTSGIDLTDKVTITGKVDTSKKGTYTLTYSVVDENGVKISKVRKVIVMDSEISLTLNNDSYTNQEVIINAYVIDEYFDYMILPDNNKVTMNNYSYKVNSNGTYTFKVYDKKGNSKESSIKVNNIDKETPIGSCTIDQDDNGSFIVINAKDSSGIAKYIYDGKSYSDNKIHLNTYIESANAEIYDNAGNSKNISCKTTSLPLISNISNDGVIVTINSKKIKEEIVGYYFSYTNKRPDKNGGYLSTSNESIEVVRLPGTTYVWAEDKAGKISNPKKITLSNEVIPSTKQGYPVLNGTSLGTHIKNKGGSLDELNKLIARSVRAAGLYTKEGAATAAVALQMVLIQKYNVKISYRMGGKSNVYGASQYWGRYAENPTYEKYIYAGLDCGGFVNWSYKNTGVVYNDFNIDNYYFWDGIEYSKENGEIGDVLRRDSSYSGIEHVAIIVGKTNKEFIVAEAFSLSDGVVISMYPYDQPNGYEIIKGEDLLNKYNLVSNDEYPSGF